jgi:hypothetical protein
MQSLKCNLFAKESAAGTGVAAKPLPQAMERVSAEPRKRHTLGMDVSRRVFGSKCKCRKKRNQKIIEFFCDFLYNLGLVYKRWLWAEFLALQARGTVPWTCFLALTIIRIWEQGAVE